jgi:hypothetical protein
MKASVGLEGVATSTLMLLVCNLLNSVCLSSPLSATQNSWEPKMTEYALRVLLDVALQTVKPYLDLIV